ncbi:VOC family protein [Undibacterium cyanobacteriorum]|uniref:VOC family protein n=1 Tax=Undibacterium cyanobacteriorum TaxID=3073561 RepID=A0ABY9RH83_9BURK|nr:VOC family protein [Undibacterium sp. 20NA77.5]WMW80594.1 VOC family protein [Undibacterium sp. 20NA77.5]
MTSSMPRPSERILLQRVRNQLIDYLEVASSFRAQREYQEQAPQVQVSLEIVEQWADWVGPDWEQQFTAPVFSEAERQAIAQYQLRWDALRKCLPETMPPLSEIQKNPVWEELRFAASAAYACFVRVGRLSESEEYSGPTNTASAVSTSASPTLGVLLYAKELATLADFYQQVLHLERDAEQSDLEHGLMVLQSSDMELTLHHIPSNYAQEIEISIPPQAREETAIKFYCRVHDLVKTRDMVEGLGGVIWSPIHQAKTYRYCDVLDPEGNVFQVRAALD